MQHDWSLEPKHQRKGDKYEKEKGIFVFKGIN